MITPSQFTAAVATKLNAQSLKAIEDHIDAAIRRAASQGTETIVVGSTRSGWTEEETTHVLAMYTAAGWTVLTSRGGEMCRLRRAEPKPLPVADGPGLK